MTTTLHRNDRQRFTDEERPVTTRKKTKEVYGMEYSVCECCGHDIDNMRWHYCPNCGAKIVDDKV